MCLTMYLKSFPFTFGLILLAECSNVIIKPRILGEKERIISAKERLELRCEGARTLRWNYPQDDKPNEFSSVNIIQKTSTDKKYKFISYLHLYNASYTDTGFYHCYYEDAEFDEIEYLDEKDSIYLYVGDNEHLSTSEEPMTITQAYYNEDFIIPCRPTLPDTVVKLYFSPPNLEEFWTKVRLNVNEDGFVVTYDATKGFIFTWKYGRISEALYKCEFKRGHQSEERKNLIVMIQRTHEIAIPNIEDLTKGHNVVGDTLQLSCSIRTISLLNIKWVLPSHEIVNCPTNGHSGRYISVLKELETTYVCYINITNTKLSDKGQYKCMVTDRSKNKNEATKSIIVFDKHENYINLTQENNIYSIPVRAGKHFIQWSIDVDAHPIVQNVWYNNKNKEIYTNAKYNISDTDTQAIIKIYDITINDRGYYTLNSSNGYETKEVKLFLNVTDKPTVYIESESYHMIKESTIFACYVAAYPKPDIYWKCNNASTKCDHRYVKSTNVKENGLALISYLNISIDKPGSVTCYANNSLGEDSATEYVRVADVRNGFDIWGYDKDKYDNKTHKHTTIVVDDDLTIYCGVSSANYTNQTYWYFSNFTLIENNQNMRYSIQRGHTSYSYRVALTIKNMQINDRGVYYCRGNRISKNLQDFEQKNITIIVLNPYAPIITKTSFLEKSVIEMNLPQKFEAFCMFEGLPKPNVVWLKDGIPLTYSKRLSTFNRNQKIVFNETNKNDEGTYTCRASNEKGRVEKHFDLKFKNKEKLQPIFIIIIVILLALLCVLFIILTIKCLKERKLKRDLKIIGLDNFEKGSPDSINPDLRIDDQAELLPYERKWEFPREKLKLGKQLGSGAFGVVLKAKAYGILEEEDSTTVAVKMVKKNADYTCIKALADELKIMIHLGKHLNVVNLLGACTGKVAKRELLVVVEFCKYGNLHNYLLRHRENFINQIDPVTETIDYSIGAEILKRTFSVSTTRSMPITPILKYAVLSCSNSNSSNQNAKDMVDYRGNNPNYTGRTAFTDTTAVCMTPTGETGDDGVTLSNNSTQPEWRYNYRGDYKENVQPISTKDLIAYAFQVARGMEYLASRKVLHGDLAARNILLAEENVVKICDFGLAKTMYKNDNYKKSGNGPLPVKWMAIESIRDRIFSTQSDIWSFGIVLWEFFSLARSPYPGMEANEQLYLKLVEGYRMDAPSYATQTIYNMMLDCWSVKPNLRPSFTRLAERLGNMLEDSVRKHYIDLNDPYLIMNTQRREEVQTDYLDMMRPPDCDEIQSPHYYVNDMDTILNNKNQEGYMVMSPINVGNGLKQNGNVFNFDVNPELRPMLSSTVIESEPPTPALSPNYPDNSVFNPSYGIAPNIEHANESNSDHIVKCADNYVNMPQNKNVLRNDKISEKTFENMEMPYINSNTRDWDRIQVQ